MFLSVLWTGKKLLNNGHQRLEGNMKLVGHRCKYHALGRTVIGSGRTRARSVALALGRRFSSLTEVAAALAAQLLVGALMVSRTKCAVTRPWQAGSPGWVVLQVGHVVLSPGWRCRQVGFYVLPSSPG